MHEFLLILKGDGMASLSPDEIQQLLKDYQIWVQNLGENYLGGQRLQNKGALIQNKETIITDGPFLESKEIIAGYFMIMAIDQNNANSIAQNSPHASYYQIEVRALVQPLMHDILRG